MDDAHELIRFKGKSFARYVRYYPSFNNVDNGIENDYLYDINNWTIREGEVVIISILDLP